MKAKSFKRLVNMYPPYLGAGVKVRSVSPDFRQIEVEMPLRWYNRNYVGTHFGGSLYSMVDPFYMVMLIHVLGPDYIVWDQAATIEFFKPGRGTMHACFRLTEDDLEAIYAYTAEGRKYLSEFTVEIVDTRGELVAQVKKTLYIRRKPQGKAALTQRAMTL
jgi:acyl-coenzyme A thioesterase PaaI-like protein